MDGVLTQLAELQHKVTGLETARENDRALIADLNTAMRTLTRKLDGAAKRAEKEDEGYSPIPAPRWWQLMGTERAEAITRLRAWVETVFRPGYGHLAEQVGPCWEQHDLCLYQLAWLSEMHTAIFLAPGRRAGQRGRLAHPVSCPRAVALMAEETGRCDHLHRRQG